MGKKNYTIKSGKKNNPFNLVLVILTLIILGVIFLATHRDNVKIEKSTLPSAENKLENNNPLDKNSTYDKPTKEISIITDKWSLLNTPNLDYKIDVNGFSGTLLFKPMSLVEYNALLIKNPKIISNALARFYSSNSTLSCKKTCQIEGKDLSLEYLASPESIPSFGELYQQLGIDSILYKATLNIPINSDVVKITANGIKPQTLLFGSNSDGSDSSNVYVAQAFGQFFNPVVLWNKDSNYTPPFRYYVDPEQEIKAGKEVKASELIGILSKGQGSTSPLLYALGKDQLTYISSPSTGCGASSICLPGKISSTFELGKSESFKVCSKNKSTAQIVILYGSANMSSSIPTFIPGLVNYKNSSNNFVTGLLGDPELVSGEFKYYLFEAYLIGDTGIQYFAGGRSIKVDGLPKVKVEQLFNNLYSFCK